VAQFYNNVNGLAIAEFAGSVNSRSPADWRLSRKAWNL